MLWILDGAPVGNSVSNPDGDLLIAWVGFLLETLLGRKLDKIDGISEEEIDGRPLGILLDDILGGTLGTSLCTRDGFPLDTLLGSSLTDSVGIILEGRLGFIFGMLLDLKLGGLLWILDSVILGTLLDLKLGRLLRVFDSATVGNNEGDPDGVDVELIKSDLHTLQVSGHCFRIWLREQ